MIDTTTPAWYDPARPVPDIRTDLPGPAGRVVLGRDTAVTSPSLPRAYAMVPARGFGSVIEDVDGNLFLDANAGIAVNSTGHSHPRVVEAVVTQARDLQHYSASDFYLPVYSRMCAALAETAPMSGPVRVFLSNSGAEAVEGALKLVRHATGRPNVVSFYGAFHGRSYGAVSLTASKAKYHKGFGPLLPGVFRAPFAGFHPEYDDPATDTWYTIDYLENVLFRYEVDPSEVAAVFVEPIQGEGGYIVPPDAWLVALRRLCDRHGILLVADEVQSGMGRTGLMWAIEHSGVEPDVLISAKGLASGLPLGAFMARAELMESWGAGAHGSTYGGSPIPCAAGLATLEVIRDEKLLNNATDVGAHLMDGLRAIADRFAATVTDVRGRGLMIGVQFRDGVIAAAVQDACFRRGLLVLEAGEDVIRLSPPLVFTREHADTALRVIAEAIAEVVGV